METSRVFTIRNLLTNPPTCAIEPVVSNLALINLFCLDVFINGSFKLNQEVGYLAQSCRDQLHVQRSTDTVYGIVPLFLDISG